MVLYDFLAPAYDPGFESIYRPFRARAFERLPAMEGSTVLDLACGTGQNFPFLAERIGPQGKIVGVDVSSGMLERARRRTVRDGFSKVFLIQADAARIDPAAIQAQTGLSSVDCVVCTYGFMAMRQWESVFWSSWRLLKPGGRYLIHDVDAERGNLHAFVVELATRCNFTRKVWRPLQGASTDFRMDYLDPSAHLFGGRLYVAYGVKPA